MDKKQLELGNLRRKSQQQQKQQEVQQKETKKQEVQQKETKKQGIQSQKKQLGLGILRLKGQQEAKKQEVQQQKKQLGLGILKFQGKKELEKQEQKTLEEKYQEALEQIKYYEDSMNILEKQKQQERQTLMESQQFQYKQFVDHENENIERLNEELQYSQKDLEEKFQEIQRLNEQIKELNEHNNLLQLDIQEANQGLKEAERKKQNIYQKYEEQQQKYVLKQQEITEIESFNLELQENNQKLKRDLEMSQEAKRQIAQYQKEVENMKQIVRDTLKSKKLEQQETEKVQTILNTVMPLTFTLDEIGSIESSPAKTQIQNQQAKNQNNQQLDNQYHNLQLARLYFGDKVNRSLSSVSYGTLKSDTQSEEQENGQEVISVQKLKLIKPQQSSSEEQEQVESLKNQENDYQLESQIQQDENDIQNNESESYFEKENLQNQDSIKSQKIMQNLEKGNKQDANGNQNSEGQQYLTQQFAEIQDNNEIEQNLENQNQQQIQIGENTKDQLKQNLENQSNPKQESEEYISSKQLSAINKTPKSKIINEQTFNARKAWTEQKQQLNRQRTNCILEQIENFDQEPISPRQEEIRKTLMHKKAAITFNESAITQPSTNKSSNDEMGNRRLSFSPYKDKESEYFFQLQEALQKYDKDIQTSFIQSPANIRQTSQEYITFTTKQLENVQSKTSFIEEYEQKKREQIEMNDIDVISMTNSVHVDYQFCKINDFVCFSVRRSRDETECNCQIF